MLHFRTNNTLDRLTWMLLDTVIVDHSEHEWEEVSPNDESGHEDLDEEPVQVGHTNQEASVVDVRSMQSSTTDFDELESETEAKK